MKKGSIRPGDLKELVTIRKVQSSTVSDTGEKTNVFADWKTVWASFAPEKGTQVLRAGRQESEKRYVMKTWYLEGFDETAILRHRGFDYKITSIVNIGSIDEALELLCVRA